MSAPADMPTVHRPWPVPAEPWAMRMTWRRLLFMHWPVAAQQLRAHVPAPLELDTFDGVAWLGVTPFLMSGVRPRAAPPVPGARRFPELNVRTYVRYGDKPGIYFFSLDAMSRLAVEAARATFGLPYFRARMSCELDDEGAINYFSERTDKRGPTARLCVRYWPISTPFPAAPESLDAFLTERYGLYVVDRRERVWLGDIHHAPWPLQPAKVTIDEVDMTRALGVTLSGEPTHVRYAHELNVVAWRVRKAG